METFDLAAEYEQVRLLGENQLRIGEIEVLCPDPLRNDMRRGLGLFFWQSQVRDASLPYLEKLQGLYPDHLILYGPSASPARQHVTFLELVAGDRYREASEMQVAEFTAVCDRILSNMPPIRASFRGFLATGSAVLIEGYPESNLFNEFRDRVRSEILWMQLPPLARRKVTLFHTTVARYVKPLGDVDPLFVDEHRHTELGEDVFSELVLTTSSWLMAAEQVTPVRDFVLK